MFYKSQRYGQLNIEKVLFEFEGEPIVFICKNNRRSRFVCVNTGYGFEPSWIVAKANITTIIRMLKDEISVLDTISKTADKVLLLKENKMGLEAIYLAYNDIDPMELPDDNAKVQNTKCVDYIQFLQNEMYKSYGPVKAMGRKNNEGFVIDLVNTVAGNFDYSSYRIAGRRKTKKKTILAEG